MRLTKRDYDLLKRAVRSHGDWRGSLTGNPDRGQLDEFDRELRQMQTTLAKVKALVESKT